MAKVFNDLLYQRLDPGGVAQIGLHKLHLSTKRSDGGSGFVGMGVEFVIVDNDVVAFTGKGQGNRTAMLLVENR